MPASQPTLRLATLACAYGVTLLSGTPSIAAVEAFGFPKLSKPSLSVPNPLKVRGGNRGTIAGGTNSPLSVPDLKSSTKSALTVSAGGTDEVSAGPTPPKAKTTILILVAVLAVTKALASTTSLSAIAESAGVISAGDTAWMLVASSFVLAMTPGLALFEAGLLRSKNTVSIIAQCLSGLSLLSVLWFFCGFSLCFGPTDLGILSSPMDHLMLKGVGWSTSLAAAPSIPGVLFASFQCMFAAITPLLVTGAFAERLKFKGFLTFSVLWSLLCYYPMCHSVWGGGWLAQKGVLDFAGGIVIHAIAGVASIVTAKMLGPRSTKPDGPNESSMPIAAAGAGLLWMGWFGFNAGSSLTAGGLAANTLLVSHLAAAAGSLVWTALDWTTQGKPTLLGILNGALAGLAGVTPASGFVHAPSGLAIGALCGLASYYGVYFLKDRMGIDDALDVSSVHGITGIVGSLAIGLYAATAINPDGANGLFFGGGTSQLVKQGLGVAVGCVWSLITTFGIMKFLKAAGMARIDDNVEAAGIDISEHGEAAYQL
mmetsp:Transcript_30206/g.69238  ORF Transcript_30206/g.69238 Transcript_30206/m.69238 type:complete len:540 (-) Transcript_30206:261-1880(-)|eukprot:CAMPEP_0113313652 /NCGR_PEP_ID=MMETSP0010_2-20120614/9989_1 /TAXON_ID=216773 ORGANISM="Corethron hystrix, Strain 308" /NCGR_SAMPLE_ID=MMETSP0010_2 /ASSEMBLY_ACC=CAM_ASM_000155 /LENGTH=539 /DNA_ID=CAMNT_0000169705 /DNA_START=154 /DNA_END=1773 /DNA_ORIENTATION=+ /assembly_acc=CAM_ASM_000155